MACILDRLTGRQTGRQTDRQRETDRERKRDRQTDRERDRQTYRQTHAPHTRIHTQTHVYTCTHCMHPPGAGVPRTIRNEKGQLMTLFLYVCWQLVSFAVSVLVVSPFVRNRHRNRHRNPTSPLAGCPEGKFRVTRVRRHSG